MRIPPQWHAGLCSDLPGRHGSIRTYTPLRKYVIHISFVTLCRLAQGWISHASCFDMRPALHVVAVRPSFGFTSGLAHAANVLRTLIEPAKAAGVALELFPVAKGTPGQDESAKLIDFARAAGSVGGLPKLKQAGPLHDAFAKALAASDLELGDASLPLALLLAVHDGANDALKNAKKAGFLTASVMNATQRLIETHVDKRRSVKHTVLSESIHDMLQNPQKNGIKLRAENCEIAYLPVVQSGGNFELRVGAACDEHKLHSGVVLVHFGSKYVSRCSNICRTLFVNPTPACGPPLYQFVGVACP